MDNSIEMRHIQKQYPGVLANDDVSVEIKGGSITCLVGENGAGKSTLMKILYGLEQPDSGEILLRGELVTFHSSRDAIRHRIGMVHQHFMLVHELSVLENIILGMEPVSGICLDYKSGREQIRKLMEDFRMSVPLEELTGNLPVGLQQKVEILKIMYRKADILILDEPTAVLTPQETRELFATLKSLAAQGRTVILITHKLDEVMEVADDIIIMRRGRVVATSKASETNAAKLAVDMVGRSLPDMIERKPVGSELLFEMKDVTVHGVSAKPVLDQVSCQVHRGEILGIAGVSGNGQSELEEVIAGLIPCDSGQIFYEGEDITGTERRQRIDLGISYIPEDRSSKGLCLPWSIAQNLVAGFHRRSDVVRRGLQDFKAIRQVGDRLVEKFDIRPADSSVAAGALSGGNQQKIVIARETDHGAKMIVAAEPTRGVDIGAISFIHNHLMEMRNRGTGIILFSSDLDEVFKLSDRVAVIYEGRLVFTRETAGITKEELGLYMAGVKA